MGRKSFLKVWRVIDKLKGESSKMIQTFFCDKFSVKILKKLWESFQFFLIYLNFVSSSNLNINRNISKMLPKFIWKQRRFLKSFENFIKALRLVSVYENFISDPISHSIKYSTRKRKVSFGQQLNLFSLTSQ